MSRSKQQKKNAASRAGAVGWKHFPWNPGLIVLAAIIAYSNSFSGPFVLDDQQAVLDNPSIQHLWPAWEPLFPPGGLTVGGRPLLNLSFALNYALGGLDVWGYHAFNLLVHTLAGLTLYGIVRRTLMLPVLQKRFGAEARPLALAIALLWIVHPLQTASVTYISQRAEALMGLFYLQTIYALIRVSENAAKGWLWSAVGVGTCLLGMATKEIMITAPLMALIYDRTFIAGSFREAWRQRGRLYLGLAGTWLALGLSFWSIHKRAVGPGEGITPWIYALTECPALVHYLCLIVWPHPLIFDYGSSFEGIVLKVLPQALLVVALLIATGIAFFRWPALGFVGVWFFVILAPTSSFIPILLSPIGEHRLYLPLAGIVALGVLSLHTLMGTSSRFVFLALALVWGTLTFQRNEDYRTELGLWSDTVAKCPDNERAHYNYGATLLNAGQPDAAIVQMQEAVRINPNFPNAHANLGGILLQQGRLAEAITQFQEALRLKPELAEAQNNWGAVLLQEGRPAAALAHFQEALRLNPKLADAHCNWGLLLAQTGHPAEALAQFQEALRLNPANRIAAAQLARLQPPAK